MMGRNTLYVLCIGVAILFAAVLSAPARRNAQRKAVSRGVDRDHPAGATLSHTVDNAVVPAEYNHDSDDGSKGYFTIEKNYLEGKMKRISKRAAADDDDDSDDDSEDDESDNSDDDSDEDEDTETEEDTEDEETDDDTTDDEDTTDNEDTTDDEDTSDDENTTPPVTDTASPAFPDTVTPTVPDTGTTTVPQP